MPNKRLTQEEFLIRAKSVHGDRYDYTETVYRRIDEKVKILCYVHGEFWQTPNNHLKGHNCPCCTKELLRKPIETFISEANIIHNNKYDYSKVDYKNIDSKVCIICPKHGEFWQTPYNHLSGKGCPKCAKNLKKSTEQFIEDARIFHGDKYDYSKVEYVDSQTKVCIICPIHGEFWKAPNNHLQMQGCPKCGYIKNGNRFRSNTNEFIKKAKQVHGDKYDYSKVEYKGNNEKVCVICPIHGEFFITPHNHLRGQGCRQCGIDRRTSTITYDLNEFIKKAKQVHGDKYDYSKVEYVNSNTEVCIICPEHGEFWQIPNSHLQGHGCSKCKSSVLEDEVRNFLIEKKIKFEEQKTFRWLRNKSNMFLDFYLPEYFITIECQGIQHFKPLEFFGGDDGHNKIIERDELKYKQCNENGVKVLYYTKENVPKEFEENYEYYSDLDNLYNKIKKEVG